MLGRLRAFGLNRALTRLVDPDATRKSKIVEFVTRGDLGLVGTACSPAADHGS